jgi:hypothetical protein
MNILLYVGYTRSYNSSVRQKGNYFETCSWSYVRVCVCVCFYKDTRAIARETRPRLIVSTNLLSSIMTPLNVLEHFLYTYSTVRLPLRVAIASSGQ